VSGGSWIVVVGGRESERKRDGELILDLIMWWSEIVAAHYHYIKEIPMFADYEIQLSIGGFEDKWVSFTSPSYLCPGYSSNYRCQSTMQT
jgi:hypothetical protein